MASVVSNYSQGSYQRMSDNGSQDYNLQDENYDGYSYDNQSNSSFQVVGPKTAAFIDDNSTLETVDSRRKKVRKAIQSMKNYDKGYHAVQDKRGEIVCEFYESNALPGSKIRDASTGISYDNYRVGSDAEDLFFKVSYCANHGEGYILFFSSPDEYERFFGVDVNASLKNSWADKQKRVLKKYGY